MLYMHTFKIIQIKICTLSNQRTNWFPRIKSAVFPPRFLYTPTPPVFTQADSIQVIYLINPPGVYKHFFAISIGFNYPTREENKHAAKFLGKILRNLHRNAPKLRENNSPG